ncbi:TadE/TadG family type IV pilus assembly protein [Bradyrhizobium sp.]|uniref:TadE/TadG family type IV pilus assembly protein n=1 Tax=Bradyrhizobium sp. TaxID=376 RepID=UPI003C562EED
MKSISDPLSRARCHAIHLLRDRSGLAAVEFAFILPLMLVMFFGTVEFSSGIAIDRKVTLLARALSDMTSQNVSVSDLQLDSFFNAAVDILEPYPAPLPNPYPSGQVSGTITELYVDPSTLAARVQWSVGTAPLAVHSTVTIPSALQVGGTYLIFSQASYLYVPTIGYVMAPAGVNLSDVAYTRPRQSLCVFYPPSTQTNPPCPTL